MTARSVATVAARLRSTKCKRSLNAPLGKRAVPPGRERLGFSFDGTDTPILEEELTGTDAERQ